MQKIFIFLMAVSITLGLTACGGGGGNDNNTTQPDREPSGNVEQPSASLSGPFVGEKAGEFGEFDISTDEGYQKLVKAVKDGALFLDIRNNYERADDYYAAGTVTGAIYEYRPSPKTLNTNFVNDVSTLVGGDKNRQIILICNSASRTGRASKWLSSKTWNGYNGETEYTGGEFTNVYHVVGAVKGEGGMEAWFNTGRPYGNADLK